MLTKVIKGNNLFEKKMIDLMREVFELRDMELREKFI
jgi:hypothetical protein